MTHSLAAMAMIFLMVVKIVIPSMVKRGMIYCLHVKVTLRMAEKIRIRFPF